MASVKSWGRLLLVLLSRKPDATAATASLLGLSAGFTLALGLGWGLIVPSGLVFACLAYTRVRGGGA